MKQKLQSYLNFLLLLIMLASVLVPGVFINSKTVFANAICSGAQLDVTVFDETTNTNLGVFAGGDDWNSYTEYNITVPYNHVLRFDLGGSGTPSFTLGYQYNSGNYSHGEHTWSPGGNPNMGGAYTAPAIQANGTFWAMRAQNVCTPPPPPTSYAIASSLWININTSGGPGNPTVITRSSNSNLAVYGKPVVSLLANGSKNITVPRGSTPQLTWSTNYVNPGNSCNASNTASQTSWTGQKNGPGGGAASVGPLDTAGVYTFDISCRGFAGSQSLVDPVTITVTGDGQPDFTCTIPFGNNQIANQGTTKTAGLKVNPISGFDLPVTFSVESVSPPEGQGNAPSVNISTQENPKLSPYDVPYTTVDMTTDSTTATGIYVIIIKATPQTGQPRNCAPINLTVVGNSLFVSMTCTGTGGPEGPCNVPYGGDSNIIWETSNVSSCNVTKDGVLWEPNSHLLNSSPTYPNGKNSGAIFASTRFDIDCTGPNGSSSDGVTIIPGPPGGGVNPPVLRANNSPCGQVTLDWTWDPGNNLVTRTNFNVFRETSGNPPTWNNNISGNLSGSTRSFIDPSPANSNNWYMVRVNVSGVGSADSNPVLMNADPCVPKLNNSDKDLFKVDNNTSGSHAVRCNDRSDVFTLPSDGIFKTGSTVYFKINICNTGNAPVTGVMVTETDAHNLDQVRLIRAVGCTSTNVGTSGPYKVSDVAPNQECTLELSGVLKNLSGSNGFLYRFWNTAIIRTNEDNTTLDPPGPTRVTTPPYLFSDTGKPTRNETAP